MDKVSTLTQKYRQASWRTQRQWLGIGLLGLVAVAMVAMMYLNVTSRATLNGREILNLNYSISINEYTNSDLQTKLAEQSASAVMQKRAEGLGFEPAKPEDIVYVVVPGYVPPQTEINLATNHDLPAASLIRPEYKQTLFEWFADLIEKSGSHKGAQ